MNRTTKAMARLGTLAVFAGTVLSTPFAIGTASATINTPVTVANGTVTSLEDAGAGATYTGQGSFTYTPTHSNSTVTVSGAGVYLPLTQAGDITRLSSTTAKCTDTGPCVVQVGDTAAEAASVFIADNTDATSATATVKFNGLFINGCPQQGMDVAQTAGSTFGGQLTPLNCVTQGQFGAPLTISGKYLAGGAGAVQNIVIFLNPGASPNAVFSGSEPAGCTIYSSDTLDCTTDASGNWSATVVANGDVALDPEQDYLTVETRGGTGTYPSIPAAPDAEGSPPAADNPPAPQVVINFGPGSVTPSRIDLVSTQVIGPSTQNSDTFGDNPNGSNEQYAEPGDVIQNVYAIYGGCTPASPTASCHGTKLAGISLPLTVDHGNFTPNCTIAGVTGYAQCSFAATPAAGTTVGSLTNSGTSVTTNSNYQGLFTVSITIGRDAAFDNTGYLTAKIRSGSLQPQFAGNLNNPTAAGCADSAGVLQPLVTRTKTLADISTLDTDGSYIAKSPYNHSHRGCYIDVQWTTDETPLNGGTAKFVVISRITNPLNNFIDSENNYNATDSGTNNIPDVGRVVKVVHFTDQYGNLSSNGNQFFTGSGFQVGNDGETLAAGPDRASLAKTGVGTLWDCLNNFSSVSACTSGGFAVGNQVTQPDGTVNQTDTNVLGSYLNVPLQNRYQMDASTGAQILCYTVAGCGNNAGQNWIGVDDGTQTDKLSWTPPTTTFSAFHAGAPNIATFAAGNGTASTDTEVDAFYNQLSAPVVTFAATPGSTVPTGTAVTVTGTVVDQNGNAIVGWPVQFVRTGANESTCVPIQNGQTNLVVVTNQAGIAGDTFSCNGAGVSNVSIVVIGPGGTQLAAGREAVTFTGANVGGGQTVEKPTLRITRHHRHHLVLHVATHPSLTGVTVHFYKVVHGLKIIVGSARTGGAGHAHLTLGGLRSGHRYHFDVKVVGLSNAFKSEFSKTISKVVS